MSCSHQTVWHEDFIILFNEADKYWLPLLLLFGLKRAHVEVQQLLSQISCFLRLALEVRHRKVDSGRVD